MIRTHLLLGRGLDHIGKELCLMMGGVIENTAYSLLKEEKIKHFCIGNQYLIPKTYMIDFMMSKGYETFRQKIESARSCRISNKDERERQKLLFLCETPQTRKDLMYLLGANSQKTFLALSEVFAGIWRASDDPPEAGRHLHTEVHTNLRNLQKGEKGFQVIFIIMDFLALDKMFGADSKVRFA